MTSIRAEGQTLSAARRSPICPTLAGESSRLLRSRFHIGSQVDPEVFPAELPGELDKNQLGVRGQRSRQMEFDNVATAPIWLRLPMNGNLPHPLPPFDEFQTRQG